MDGAIFYSQKAAGVGVIIQDHEDKFIVSLCKKIQATFGAIEVKAKAFELGLLFAKKVGILDFVLEGDSFILFNLCVRMFQLHLQLHLWCMEY